MVDTKAEAVDRVRAIGTWSARAMVGLEAAYIVVFIIGFASLGNASDPLRT